MERSMKVFVVMDSSDSWGDLQAYGVFKTRREAEDSICPEEFRHLLEHLGQGDEGFHIPDKNNLGRKLWGYEAFECMAPEEQGVLNTVLNRTISETEFKD